MFSFINEVLVNLLRNIMSYFVKRSVLDGTTITIDMTENGNLLHFKNVTFSTAAMGMLKNPKSAVSTNQKDLFLKEHKKFLIGIVQKL